MHTLSYSAFEANLAGTFDRVAVIVSIEDFNAYEETAYLMRSPKNAQRKIN